jgi:hypothetical protein
MSRRRRRTSLHTEMLGAVSGPVPVSEMRTSAGHMAEVRCQAHVGRAPYPLGSGPARLRSAAWSGSTRRGRATNSATQDLQEPGRAVTSPLASATMRHGLGRFLFGLVAVGFALHLLHGLRWPDGDVVHVPRSIHPHDFDA